MSQLSKTYRNLLERYGFEAELVRPSTTGSKELRVRLLARRRFGEEDVLIHDVSQDSTWFHIGITELNEAGFPLPVKKGDRLFEDGAYYTCYVAEPVRDGPNIIGYRMRTIGGA